MPIWQDSAVYKCVFFSKFVAAMHSANICVLSSSMIWVIKLQYDAWDSFGKQCMIALRYLEEISPLFPCSI